MTEPEPASDNFDGERESEKFIIQPYQFEPRVNSGEADHSENESRAGSEGAYYKNIPKSCKIWYQHETLGKWVIWYAENNTMWTQAKKFPL